MMDPRSTALAAFARFQITEASVGETLHCIAEITLDAVSAASIAGMTMLGDDGQPVTAVYTDKDSPEIDEAQYRDGTGPCLDAWRERRVLRVDNVADWAQKYPAFAGACQEHGVLSTLSMPLVTGDEAIGALNLYAPVVEGFNGDDESLASDLAGAAAAVLANVSAYWTAFDLNQNLNEAMKSRAVIEQAKGVLMAQRRVDAEQAFEILREASQRYNRKLRDIALGIVESTQQKPR
jgi:GAF domain-containing protein